LLLLLLLRGLRVLVSYRRPLLLQLTRPHTTHPAAQGAGTLRQLDSSKKSGRVAAQQSGE
jgi:hypothetical protein